MARRSRSQGRSSKSSDGRAGARRHRPRHRDGAQPPPVSYWYLDPDEIQAPADVRVLPFTFPYSDPGWLPTSIPRESPLFKPVALGVQPKATPFIQWRFHYPRLSLLCLKRAIRRRVLHALRIAGRKGVGAGKPRRMNVDSTVSC